MAKHEKKPKRREFEFEISILWFKLMLPPPLGVWL